VVLSFSDGRRVALRGPVLVGRNPAAYDGETVQELVSVADPERSVSKTHLTVWTERGRVWVQDRKSTNGTHVVREDGSGSPLDPGLPLEVSAGDVVHFGDYFFSVGISREARA
jgi:pSer/pThr/pTyr-binding forkhead associated (FHA) protein